MYSIVLETWIDWSSISFDWRSCSTRKLVAIVYLYKVAWDQIEWFYTKYEEIWSLKINAISVTNIENW